ncbi:hypothetical protein BDV95DRAFT_593681 [Massariosphaeria phaeospora]|uniref:Uncharacterized protein n=1 Tax=Massariosphaeria phaeospora TaxID=100035 RepID=A0A7C8M9A6_9PLEO|nr:hypothetical protein BDV95DRAFT_593681 [Massariosphaeria phaeospora]
MDDHEPDLNSIWKPSCGYLCMREKLVASLLQHTREYGVMVIRATPMVGKTSLLKLLGYHILHNERDLEPVFVEWEKREKRNDQPYGEFLRRHRESCQRDNAEARPRNKNARIIYLIDEAQNSYEEQSFWSQLKDYHATRQQALFVLVCVFGATGVSSYYDPDIESQALRMHALHRIELRPSTSSSLCMLLRQDEVAFMVNKFATVHGYQLHNRVAEYLYSATNGHPGMVGLLLDHVANMTKGAMINVPQTLTLEFFHNLLVEREDSYVEWLTKWGRGVWSPYFGSGETLFTFASPLHRRVAYRRLYPGREPDAVVKNTSLQQYSHTKDGRIDLFVAARKWGIEILQCGSNTALTKHISRFAPGGNYHSWDLMDDYIILNFCTRSALASIKISDKTTQSNLFHVIIEPDKLSAEIYTHDKQLHMSWSLSEGRQRKNLDDFCGIDESLSNEDSERMLTQEDLIEDNHAMTEVIEWMKEREEEREKEMKEREKEMKEREKEMKEREEEREKEMKEREEEREKEMKEREEEREKEMKEQEEEREKERKEMKEREKEMKEREKEMKEREEEREKEMKELKLQIEQRKEERRLQREQGEDQNEIAHVQDKSVKGTGSKRKR